MARTCPGEGGVTAFARPGDGGEKATITRRAPGKLFIAGEFAVVEPGQAAVLVAVDRYVTATATAGPGSDVCIVSDMAAGARRFERTGTTLSGDSSGVRHAVSAIETVEQWVAEFGQRPAAVEVRIDSALHDGGVKYGLGSSAAVTVAVAAAVSAFHGMRLSAGELFRLAMIATVRIDARSSGADLAASAFGGWIAYRSPDRAQIRTLVGRDGVGAALRARWPGLAVRRLPAPAGADLLVGWTGTPALTADRIAALDTRNWWRTAGYARFARNSDECVRGVAAALRGEHPDELLRQIHRARRLLTGLDTATGLGIFTERLAALCAAAETAGGAAKPSGAGGGDCGIALLGTGDPDRRTELTDRWRAADIRPLPLAVAYPEGTPVDQQS
ncbi:phosphomevalonate kinase [Nocardia mexicana]|uniref:Phosphomevalonate kinase n=1 Tax=Nocardia mexicana TaxID=279262 RepID=A0A370H1Z9_9NOCA|nr:phosphomevalonate kinase [Nocardia mexicana]